MNPLNPEGSGMLMRDLKEPPCPKTPLPEDAA